MSFRDNQNNHLSSPQSIYGTLCHRQYRRRRCPPQFHRRHVIIIIVRVVLLFIVIRLTHRLLLSSSPPSSPVSSLSSFDSAASHYPCHYRHSLSFFPPQPFTRAWLAVSFEFFLKINGRPASLCAEFSLLFHHHYYYCNKSGPYMMRQFTCKRHKQSLGCGCQSLAQ